MKLRNCKDCGALYLGPDHQTRCKHCTNSFDEEARKVKDFLYQNPKATVEDIFRLTGVSKDIIVEMRRTNIIY